MKDPRPLVGIGIIILKDNKVLLLKRKGSHGTGTWAFIGGHLEQGETVEEGAKREVTEEVGVTIKNLKRAGYTEDFFKDEEKHYITLFIIAEIDRGKVKNMEPEKSTEVKWFDWDNFPKPLFKPVSNLRKTGFNPFSF